MCKTPHRWQVKACRGAAGHQCHSPQPEGPAVSTTGVLHLRSHTDRCGGKRPVPDHTLSLGLDKQACGHMRPLTLVALSHHFI